jgi:hypothetical protein
MTEALAIYNKAKSVLAQHKEGGAYGALVNDMATSMWNCNSGARPLHGTRKLLSLSANCVATSI